MSKGVELPILRFRERLGSRRGPGCESRMRVSKCAFPSRSSNLRANRGYWEPVTANARLV